MHYDDRHIVTGRASTRLSATVALIGDGGKG
jgi:hypothetical protein